MNKTLSINGLNLNVLVEGEGPPVLLLHGFPDSIALWRNQARRLAWTGYKVIAYDQRGFGASDAPAGAEHYTLDMIESDALAVLDALGVDEKVYVIGHDFGAVVAWLLAIHHPDRVRKLVAVSVGHPRAYVTAGLAQKLKGWYTLGFRIPGLAEILFPANDWLMMRRFIGHPTETERWIADLSRPGRLTAGLNWYRANFGALARAKYGKVTIPTLGIWSTGDVALTEAQMVNSSRYVDAPWQYERIEGATHWIPVDAPDRLNELLLDFFKS